MQKSSLNFSLKPPSKQRRLSFGNCYSPRELVPESARNNYQAFVEPPQSQPTLSSFTSRKPVLQTLSYRIPQSYTPTAASSLSNEGFTLNKKLIKGYSKFLEEKGFLSRRDEERQKVHQDVKNSLAYEEKKIISSGIQRLITSAIINDPIKRPRTVFKPVSDNYDLEVNKYDEKHKQVCNRILGNDFENGMLFMKVQKENMQSTKTQRSSRIHKKFEIQEQKKGSSRTNKKNEQPTFENQQSNLLKCATGITLCTLDDYDRDEDKKLTPDINVPSLNLLGLETNKEIEGPITLEEMPIQYSNYSHNKLSEILIENDKKLLKQSSTRSKRLLFDASDSFSKDLKGRTERSKQSQKGNAKMFEANLHRNLKTKLQFQKFGRKYKSVLEDHNENLTKSTSQLNTVISPVREGIDKLNQLCEGAIKSTNRLGIKLRQHHLKTGREYGNLDILMEKLSYENTIGNWEKSIKQINKIEQKQSSFKN